jgi:flavodoxin I
LILGTSTWEDGELQEDWYEFLPAFDEIDLSGKLVALFGVGNAVRYPDNFGDAVGKLFDEVTSRGAKVIGAWPADNYEFLDSEALREGKLVGLLIDTGDDATTTRRRIEQWVEKIRPALGREREGRVAAGLRR